MSIFWHSTKSITNIHNLWKFYFSHGSPEPNIFTFFLRTYCRPVCASGLTTTVLGFSLLNLNAGKSCLLDEDLDQFQSQFCKIFIKSSKCVQIFNMALNGPRREREKYEPPNLYKRKNIPSQFLPCYELE